MPTASTSRKWRTGPGPCRRTGAQTPKELRTNTPTQPKTPEPQRDPTHTGLSRKALQRVNNLIDLDILEAARETGREIGVDFGAIVEQ